MLPKALTEGSDKFWTPSPGICFFFLLLISMALSRGHNIHLKQKLIIDYSSQALHSPDLGQALCCQNPPAVRILLLRNQLLGIRKKKKKKKTEGKTTKTGP